MRTMLILEGVAILAVIVLLINANWQRLTKDPRKKPLDRCGAQVRRAYRARGPPFRRRTTRRHCATLGNAPSLFGGLWVFPESSPAGMDHNHDTRHDRQRLQDEHKWWTHRRDH